ncbi:MAG: hypothetical protein HY881_24465 [Deltaproteobacteria bacterium]|nr:hypothetical protein [Deltaproteobacteria bacterium]
MTDFLTNFDIDKNELASRIAAAPSLEAAVELTDAYLSKLHGDITRGCSLQKSRSSGYLIEIVRYAVRMLNTVEPVVHMAEPRFSDARAGLTARGFVMFGKAVQSAIILALLIALLSINQTPWPTPWIPILLVVILLGIEIYLLVFEWRIRSVSKKCSGAYTLLAPLDISNPLPPKVEVQLKIAHVHAFLNCIADALSHADKALTDQTPEKESAFLEKETQILKLFQDLFEAKTFHDGEWALKKIGHIQAILWEQGIVVREFDPKDPADTLNFDIEPGADPSINCYVTIRPAFIKGKRVLLRGRVAEPFSNSV